ncbi:Imm8 family immunity protein [Paenibacillus illinoisensis]|uniref:Imm8 family immunity protein n=1 Tax=Paenibacillus illinoisensis TaxID=59845 RepID=UPI001C8D143D|nr:Imm8 family immunity protein [Paenibacillus illinoisensis]
MKVGYLLVIPVLKDIEVNEVSDGLKGFKLRCIAYIAEEEDIGSDCFHFQVLSPEYVISYLSKDQYVLNGRAKFILQEFDVEMIKLEINKILTDCIRPTWEEAAQAINRHLKWEYDNIKLLSENEVQSELNLNT